MISRVQPNSGLAKDIWKKSGYIFPHIRRARMVTIGLRIIGRLAGMKKARHVPGLRGRISLRICR